MSSNTPNTGEILLYQTADGLAKIEVTLVNETVWLTIDQMATLFQRNKSTISRHIRDAFECGELNPDSTVAFFATVQKEGERNVSRDIQYYNLDMIISVGYRVHSLRGVQFRMWATRTLKEYLIKGFAMSTMILGRKPPRPSSGPSRTRCTTPSTAIPQRNSFTTGPMPNITSLKSVPVMSFLQ